MFCLLLSDDQPLTVLINFQNNSRVSFRHSPALFTLLRVHLEPANPTWVLSSSGHFWLYESYGWLSVLKWVSSNGLIIFYHVNMVSI